MPLTCLRAVIFAATVVAAAGPALAQNASVGFGGGGHDNRAQVEIAADSLVVDQATGQATLRGNVVIAQDTLRLTATTVEVNYSDVNGKRTIQSLHAQGEVLIVAGDDAAEGQDAVYTLGSGQIVMTGDVLLTQGANALAGNTLVVDLATGSGTVSGRVRTVLQVSE
jgi:lipopolysaccharide export system protein LptA